LKATLAEIEADGLTKRERLIAGPQGGRITIEGKDGPRSVINLCANNYLGLADHPDVIAAAHQGLDAFGFGMASVRFICGAQTLHRELEQSIARYLEQLYTFADRDRDVAGGRVISISYLGLTRQGNTTLDGGAGWTDWYRYFPWEDHRTGVPAILGRIRQALADTQADDAFRQRAATAFAMEGQGWNEELTLQRYELLY